MAETPPPFQMPAPPAAKATNSANRTCLIIVLMLVVLCGVFCVIGSVFMKGLWGQLASAGSCAATFEMSYEATMQYANEHDGKFPQAATWQDVTQPYYERLHKHMTDEMKEVEMLKSMIPPAPGAIQQCVTDGRTTGIAFNSELSGKKISDFKDPEKTVVFFETDGAAKNLSMKYAPMPKSKAPKLMNEERDWIIYYIKGNTDPFESSSSKRFKMSPEDAKTPTTEKVNEK